MGVGMVVGVGVSRAGVTLGRVGTPGGSYPGGCNEVDDLQESVPKRRRLSNVRMTPSC